MTAFSPPATLKESNTPISAGAYTRTRTRAITRELLGNWLGPLLIVVALAACHQIGLFGQIDGRFFDAVTVNQPGRSPSVVVVERDEAFDAQGPERFGELESDLARLGVERIGYLGYDRGAITTSETPIIIGLPTQALPENQRFELRPPAAGIGAGIAAARSIALAQYGINRSQSAVLPGRSGTIPVFEAALADTFPPRSDFLIPMPQQQSIPVLRASQLTSGQMERGELAGLVAMVVRPEALRGSLSTPLSPDRRATSEAIFRAHAINSLRSGQIHHRAQLWESWIILLAIGAMLALVYRTTDPKRLAVMFPLACSVLILAACWAVLQFTGKLLPVSAMLIAPWIVTFQRVLERETSQDRRLERTASRAVQTSFNRSALREGARLPHFLGSAAQYAGVERSLLIEWLPNGKLEAVAANNASIDDIELAPRQLRRILKEVRDSFGVRDAAEIVPGWEGEARIGWVGTGEQQLFWLHTRPETTTPGKSAHLVRALVNSFRELFRWRADLNARSSQEDRHLPIDNKVASAIALVANESEQVRRGFDTIDTAVIIFHLIGSPLHANEAMQELYREAGLSLFDTSLSEVLLALTDLDEARVEALIEDLMLNGSEMRMPMRDLGDGERQSERMLRLAAPVRNTHVADRILVLEAIDMRNANRAADLRKAVAKFIDLQLRNDFEAILLGSQLACDDRLDLRQVRSVVERIDETARRATGRLDEVADLIRSDTSDLTEACYPVDATAVVKDAVARASGFADELGVIIEAEHPGVSGFTLAEPVALTDMLVSMLRVVIADTPQNGAVKLKLEELAGRTHIRISGGFGIGFERLLWLIANYEEGAVGEYRVIGEGMAKVTRWSASVSYWGSEANGFGFNVDLRGIG